MNIKIYHQESYLSGGGIGVRTFLKAILFTLLFVTSISANVVIEGDSTTYTVAIGDTISITSKKNIAIGENLVRWEIVSGTGTFIDSTADSTGFIPSSDSVTLRRITRTLPIYELTDTFSKFFYDKNSVAIPSGSHYGIRTFFNANDSGQYVAILSFKQSTGFLNYSTDSTFSKSTSRTCIGARCYVNAKANTKHHLLLYLANTSSGDRKDSIKIRVERTHILNIDTTSTLGKAYIDSSGSNVTAYTKAIKTDSIKIKAIPDTNNVFEQWKVVSGPCRIRDTKQENTTVFGITSNCTVKAFFREGTIYTITDTPVQYNFTDHLYSKKVSAGAVGVWFSFTAPTSGAYTFVVSNEMTQDNLVYRRYVSSNYKVVSLSQVFKGTYSQTLNLNQGETVAIIVSNTTQKPNSFWINYSRQSYRLTLNTDGFGKVKPDSGYKMAFEGSKYTISAEGNDGYRFSEWRATSGMPTIDDKFIANTFATINNTSEIIALFKPSEIYNVTKTEQTFNFQKNYYTEKSRSTIRFRWTPPDTGTYVIHFDAIDSLKGIYVNYSDDSSFTRSSTNKGVKGKTGFFIKGTPGKPIYWSFKDSSETIPDKSFKCWISDPSILNVNTTKGGAVNPPGRQYTQIGDKTILTAWPYGGYTFKSWVATKCNLIIDNPKDPRTTVIQKDMACAIKATYSIDTTAEPSLKISQLDLGNYPEICASVSVTDKNTALSFYGLTSSDFRLSQDEISIRPQVTSITSVSGVSVVIVIDESGSMSSNNRMAKTKEAIRDFIGNMGPYDRTAIVGFRGGDSTYVHHTMTSDKNLLVKSLDSVRASGNTNIITGANVGLQQIVNESNPTAVIVFSDGENSSADSKKLDDFVKAANEKNTAIYTIGLETTSEFPLKDMAKRTGGTFTFASDASELAGIYAAIRDNVKSQYVVCFQSPDSVQNSGVHDIVIQTTFNKKNASDTVQWTEKSMPPTITLTQDTRDLINNEQMANRSITISAYITSGQNIQTANLYMRTSSPIERTFEKFSMRNVRDSLWEFVIPANEVMAPGIDFYMTAEDDIGQIGKSPKIKTPSKEPYTIFVNNDIPETKIVSVACEDSTKNIKTFTFKIDDRDGIMNATLYYRDSRAVIFQEIPLAYSAQNGTWSIEIPADTSEYSSINYYIRATDALGATVRYTSNGFFNTDACIIKTDTIPKDSIDKPIRDTINYSLIADVAEIYDLDLDGMADFVRIHFNDEHDNNISNIDSIFWNSSSGEWRSVPKGAIQINKIDGKWAEAPIEKPFNYGLTKADLVKKPFLSFSTDKSNKLENVLLIDKVGAVPVKAVLHPGKTDLKEYMDPYSEDPPDTLVIHMSEPIMNNGVEDAWKKLFRYSNSCKDTTSYELNSKEAPIIQSDGLKWSLLLDNYTIKTGFCLFTDPQASYVDSWGNGLGRGGVGIEGNNGIKYLDEVKPLQSVSGIGDLPDWLPPGGFAWERMADTLSAIRVKTFYPYTADVYIYDGISTFVTHFQQKFGYDGEMDHPLRMGSDKPTSLGFLYWNQRSEKGRKIGPGIYIWKILFTFEDGHKELRIITTGIVRKKRK